MSFMYSLSQCRGKKNTAQVYVEFSDSVGAVAAAEGLGGRDFDGRTIQTAFLDEAAWDNGELDDHTTPV